MARQFKAFDPLPKTALNHNGKSVLRRAASTDDRPRFICRGRTNGQAEFVIDVRDIPDSVRELIPGGVLVDVFGINGESRKFQLMRNADNTCVFTAATREPLIGTIIGRNEDIGNGIQLWGYPKQNLRVFVLTVGLFAR